MRIVLGLIIAIIVSLGAFARALPSASAQSPASGPALETPEATLAAHLHCPASLANLNRDPVLLVPGTGLNGGENYDWGYVPALKAAGFASCTVDVLDGGMGDVQLSAEYVVYAIRKMATDSGRDVAVIAYSQGGLDARWALRYWPDTRQLVSDFIGLAPSHHGADGASLFCSRPEGCGPSILQQIPTSRLVQTIDKGAQVWAPVDYTTIYTFTDGTVTPPALRSSLVAAPGVNVANIAVQDICPQNAVVHISVPADGVVWAVVLDALLRPGPADASRISKEICTTLPYVPGVTAEIATGKATELNGIAFGRVLGYPSAAAEPAIKAYAAADAPAPVAPVAPRPPSTGNGLAGDGGPADFPWVTILGLAVLAAAGTTVARRR